MALKKYISLKIIGFGILIWLLFHINIRQVVIILFKSNLFYTGGALILSPVYMYFKILRYHYFLIQQKVKIPFISTIQFSLAAMYLSFITPGRLGEVSKGYFIHKSYNAPLHRLFSSIVLDRLFDVYALLLTSLAGFIITQSSTIDYTPMIALITVTAALPFVFLIKSFRNSIILVIRAIQKRLTGSDSWSGHLRIFFSEINSLLNRKLILSLAATFVSYTFFFASCHLLSLSIGINLSYFKIAFFIACSNILSFLPISFAGIGTREASLVYLFSLENLSSESALAFSTLVFSFTYILVGIIGFFCFMTLHHTTKSLPDDT